MLTIALAVLVSFFTVFFLAEGVRKFLERIGVTGVDQQKKEKPTMATSVLDSYLVHYRPHGQYTGSGKAA